MCSDRAAGWPSRGSPSLGLPLASDLSHADKAHDDSGRQNWAKRLEYICH